MASSKIKTKITKVTPKDFIASVPNETRRKDAEVLLKLFEKVTGWKPKMWGPTIVGFGKYTYTYETGHSGEICVVGFSPRSASLVVYYGGCDLEHESVAAQFQKLGKHKLSAGGCLYINKLADIDVSALEKIIKLGLTAQKKLAAGKGWTIRAT